MSWLDIGYSGSRDGMTRPQLLAVHRQLAYVLLTHDGDPDFEGIRAHFGDCKGGDHEFFVIATILGCRTIAHPPLQTALRAFCPADEIRPAKGYLARDYDIAAESVHGLLAAPKSPHPVQGSGTWATVGYAIQLDTPALVFRPEDGTAIDVRTMYGRLVRPSC